MADAVQVWEEVKLQARMKYLAFKRSIIVMEVALLIASFIALSMFNVPFPIMAIVLVAQILKIVGEHHNHWHLAQIFGTPDRWVWLPISVCAALALA